MFKVIPRHSGMKRYMGCGSKIPYILKVGAGWRQLLSSKLKLFRTWRIGQSSYTLFWMCVWVCPRVFLDMAWRGNSEVLIGITTVQSIVCHFTGWFDKKSFCGALQSPYTNMRAYSHQPNMLYMIMACRRPLTILLVLLTASTMKSKMKNLNESVGHPRWLVLYWGYPQHSPFFFIYFMISDFMFNENESCQVALPTAFTWTGCNWRRVDVTFVFIQNDRYKYIQLLYTAWFLNTNSIIASMNYHLIKTLPHYVNRQCTVMALCLEERKFYYILLTIMLAIGICRIHQFNKFHIWIIEYGITASFIWLNIFIHSAWVKHGTYLLICSYICSLLYCFCPSSRSQELE
jgi:hypothetical protein